MQDALDDSQNEMGGEKKTCQCVSRNKHGEDCLFLDNSFSASGDNYF